MIKMAELKSQISLLLSLIALFVLSSFISLQLINISTASSVCSNFSADLKIENDEISLKAGEGKLIKGNITNTGFENEFVFSLKGPKWVVVRPQTLELSTDEVKELFVYVSPGFGVKGNFDIKLLADAPCVHLEKTIKANVQ